ncbi:hypothetical protein Tco_0851331 [Tanacetum coccineum]
MVTWPLYAEQKMNRVYLVEEIKVALRLEMSTDGFVTAEAVEQTVTKMMDGEEGKMLRERVIEMSLRAKATMEDDGSCRIKFIKLTQPWTDDKVWRGKWDPLVAESGEGDGWEEEVGGVMVVEEME